MLIMWDEEVAELHTHSTYFANDGVDGVVETSDSEFLCDLKSKRNSIVCIECRLNVHYHVVIEKSVFLQILKYSYRDANSPDNHFKINLKSRKGQKSMVPPTLQEIKEAMVEELI